MKKSVSITLDVNVISAIQDLAAYEDRSFSNYINLILQEHIKGMEELLKTIQESKKN